MSEERKVLTKDRIGKDIIEKAPIEYVGRRPFVTRDVGHYRFLFDKDNEFVQSVPKQFIPTIMKTGEFMPVTDSKKLARHEKREKEKTEAEVKRIAEEEKARNKRAEEAAKNPEVKEMTKFDKREQERSERRGDGKPAITIEKEGEEEGIEEVAVDDKKGKKPTKKR